MLVNESEEGYPAMPQKIGCRICMSTARMTEQFSEASSVDGKGDATPGKLSYGTYRCEEGHVTHAAFDHSDGSLRIYEPDESEKM